MVVDRRRFLRAVSGLAALAVVAPSTLAHAGEVEVTAVLGRPQVEPGQSVYLQVEVSSSAGAIGTPRFESDEGLDITSRGTSSGMSIEIAAGRRVQRATKTFTYVVAPRRAGEYEIGIEVDVGGQTYRPATAPKLIATGEDFEPQLEHGKSGDKPDDPSEDVIVWPVVDESKVYVGEQIVYELQIWDRGNANLAITTSPTFKDFWSENLDNQQQQRRPNVRKDYIGNVPYQVNVPLRRALFPQKAGTLIIGSPEIQSQPFNSVFFGSSGPPRSYLGRNLAIEVLPLPADGQPQGFRANNVGQFSISSEVDRTALRQGEALRLSIRIAGTGNIALIELPELPALTGLRSYEAKPETPKLELGKPRLRGSRVYTMLIVAEHSGRLEIPAIELPYFDPDKQRYEVARSKPIVLDIEADPNAKPAASDGAQSSSEDDDETDELLAPPIATPTLPRVTPRERWLTRERWWLGSLGAPAVLGLGWAGLRLRERLGPTDLARARAQEAARRRELLNQANAKLDDGAAFYPVLGSLLQSAAVARAGSEGVGLPRQRLLELLERRGLAREELDQLGELLEACDAARFGAGGGDIEQRRAHLERARALLGRASWRPS